MFLFLTTLTYSKLQFAKNSWLLPYKDTNYHINPSIIIETEDKSCVKFESASNDIRIIPIYSDNRICSRSARFEVTTSGSERKSIIVLAKSGEMHLELKFFLDNIKYLDFKSSTRSVYLNGAPGTFNLVGRDDKNNTFDSLEGLHFDFKFDNSYLARYSSKESFVQYDSSISLLGTNIGKAWLSGHYKDVSCMIALNVINPIFLHPGPVLNVFPNVAIPFKLCTMKGFSENMETRVCEREITYDETLHKIYIDNQSVLTIGDGFLARTDQIGRTLVRVVDRSVEDNIATVVVNVQYPASVAEKDHYILLGTEPKFNPVFNANPGKRMDIFEPIPYYIEHGSWDTLGNKRIGFRYMEYSWAATVVVCEPISIRPSNATLPTRYNNYPITVSGGSGRYTLKSSSNDLAILSGNQLTTYREGDLIITAFDELIEGHYANGYITISRIHSSTMDTEYTELVSGSSNDVRCTFYAYNRRTFSVEMDYEIVSDRTDIIPSKPLNQRAHLQTNGVGFVNLQCRFGEYTSDKKLFSVVSNLRANVEGLAAPNSSIPLTLYGGPVQWPGAGTPYIDITCPEQEVRYFGHSFKILDEFKGLCTITSTNPKTPLNLNPVTMKTTVFVEVVNVHNYSLHLVDKNSTDLYYCETPSKSLDLSRPERFRYYVNTVTHDIYTFARDINNRIIVHHDAEIERLIISKIIEGKPDLRIGFRHYTYRFFEDTQIVLRGIKDQVYDIRVVSPLHVKSIPGMYVGEMSKMVIGITGGTTKYDLVEPRNYVSFTNESLIADATPGIHKYTIKDKCSNVNHITAEAIVYVADALDIFVNKTVVINKEFSFNVIPKMGNSIIPSQFHDRIQVVVYPLENVIPDPRYPLHFKGIGTSPGLLRITVKHRSLESSKDIYVIDKIDVQPREITMLSGDVVKLTKVSGPDDLDFVYRERFLTISNLSVTAIRDGNHTITIKSNKYPELEPVIISIHVPKPINLEIESDSQSYVEGGHLSLSLKVVTTMGTFIPSKVTWDIPNLAFENRVPHIVFANLTRHGLTTIRAEAFGLSKQMTIDIEEELKVDKREIYLAPGSWITLKYNVECKFGLISGEQLNVSDYGLIQAGSFSGSYAVKAAYRSQTAIIVVNVVYPSKIALMEPTPGSLYLILLTKDGRHYDSYSGITFDVAGIDHLPFKVNYCSYKSDLYRDDTEITLYARSSGFDIFNNQTLRVRGSISPSNVILHVGSRIKFTTNAPSPLWSVTSRDAHISQDGEFYSNKQGNYTIVCNRRYTATAMVVSTYYLRPIKESNRDIRFEPVFNDSNIQFHDVIWPSDMEASCECKTAMVKLVKSSLGFFCTIEGPADFDHDVILTLKSKDANMNIKSSSRSKSDGSEINLPDHLYVKVSEKMDVELPKIGIPLSEIDIDSHIQQLTVKKHDNKIVLSAVKPFRDGTVELIHANSGRRIMIHVAWDRDNTGYRTRLTYHFYFISGLIIVILFYIIDLVTRRD